MMKLVLTSPEVFTQIFKEINVYLNWLVNLMQKEGIETATVSLKLSV